MLQRSTRSARILLALCEGVYGPQEITIEVPLMTDDRPNRLADQTPQARRV
jgi:hypothetical protein